jgi:glutamate-ammonia-ligase adenylyltransferase
MNNCIRDHDSARLANASGARKLEPMLAALPCRITTTLPLTDAGRAQRTRARVDAVVYEAWAEAAPFLDAVFAAAPYLGRLACRRPATLMRLANDAPEVVLADVSATAREAGADPETAMALLRQAKADMHLATALADLAGAFSLEAAVGAVSDFADAAVQASLEAAVRSSGLPVEDRDNPAPGLFVLTLGKHGQRSLNYSSDIDPVVVWEPERIGMDGHADPTTRYTRLTRKLSAFMQDVTEDGYVFRVDLRLRPDPSSTPAAVNAEMARHYFEAQGQNWERAAYAKARVCAGDQQAGAQFLADLDPFIWRRSLDFEAVDDIRGIARQIQSRGRRAEIMTPGHDVKLGRGGIREIEFFAQILQMVFGGRRKSLRVSGTLKALPALAAEKLIDDSDARAMSEAYRQLRAVEHRIQMLEDEQSQTVPQDDETRTRLAALMGEADLAAFDAHLMALMTDVHARFARQFDDGESLATQAGSLVLTGVEPTPETLETLTAHGFSDPERVWARLAGWAGGKARAARTERARALFSRFAPRLVEGLSATGDPDAALTRFAAFFEGLPVGVQPLSLLVKQPALATELLAILGLAPRLAETLARRPALMDMMLDPSFATPIREDKEDRYTQRFDAVERGDFEDALNDARRLAREESLRIGAQLLLGRAKAGEAGRAFAQLADAATAAMAQAAEEEVARRHGPSPGRWAVLGLGKHGGRELSADSDLDLVVVYDPANALSAGPKPITAEAWFVCFTQRLVAALSAPTEEGLLYDVDMALRPSGRAGPIAVRLSRFEAYYASDEAWTWERMALTRARVVACNGLTADAERALQTAIAGAGDAEKLRADALDMRRRLLRDKPARSDWDLKLRDGGLIEIEFITQVSQLINERQLSPNTGEAIAMLRDSGALSPEDAQALALAHEDYASLTQLIRAAHGSGFDPSTASAPFAERLAAACGETDLAAVEARLAQHAARVRALFERQIGAIST